MGIGTSQREGDDHLAGRVPTSPPDGPPAALALANGSTLPNLEVSMEQTAVGRVALGDHVQARPFAEAPSPYASPDQAKAFAAQRGQSWFPQRLLDALTDMRLGLGPAALVIERVPVRLTTVRTPDAPGEFDDGGEWTSEACLLAVADFLGIAYGYGREHKGAIIQQVVALPTKEGVKSSQGADDLPFHTENSFAATRPDFVLLLCRRTGPALVPTFVLDVKEVVSRLSEGAAELLGEPIFSVSSPASFGDPPFMSSNVSVIDRAGDQLGLRIDLEGLLTSEDPQGRAALAELFAATRGAGTAVALKEGELLVIDNRRAGHARPGFTTVFDGRQRWLQRCLVRCEFWSCREHLAIEGVQFL